jgi:hypothetical protein
MAMPKTKSMAKMKGKVKPTHPPATKAPALKKSRSGIKIKSKNEDICLDNCISIGHWDRVVLGLTEFSTAMDADTAYQEAKDKFEYMQKRYEALKARMRAARP